MIAYNKQWLDSSDLQEQLENAVKENYISKAERDTAAGLYPVCFYTPNIFIRIGLFLLTLVITSFSLGLMGLLFISGSQFENSAGMICVFFAAVCYTALEAMVRAKHHYQSGVDDALLWTSAGLLLVGINIMGNISPLANAVIILIIAVFFTLRFADRLMALVIAVASLAVIFFMLTKMGTIAKAITPFTLMLSAVFLYLVSKKNIGSRWYRYYKKCFTVISITALVCFYLVGNYFVVREASIKFFNLPLGDMDAIPFGWLFWVFTSFIPLLYIAWGIQKKDVVLIRCGVLLLGVTVFTVRYYYHVMPAETAMIIAGLLLVAVSYALIKFLKEPRSGFTSLPSAIDNNNGLQNIEAILVAETFTGHQQQTGTNFGGGSFGGAGATSEF